MEERAYCGPTDRTLVCLHTHDLTAVNAKTHMAAGKNNCVLCSRVANHTFSLGFVSNVGGIVVYSIDIIQVHDLVVIEKLLLQEFETKILRSIFLERTISKLNVLSSFAFVACWVDSLNGENDWIKIFLDSEKIFLSAALSSVYALIVGRDIYHAKILW